MIETVKRALEAAPPEDMANLAAGLIGFKFDPARHCATLGAELVEVYFGSPALVEALAARGLELRKVSP